MFVSIFWGWMGKTSKVCEKNWSPTKRSEKVPIPEDCLEDEEAESFECSSTFGNEQLPMSTTLITNVIKASNSLSPMSAISALLDQVISVAEGL